MSAVGELGMFVGTILLNLYENEVEGLGPGPRRRGGAVVATAPPWTRAEPLTNGTMLKPKQACLPPVGLPLIYCRVAHLHLFYNNSHQWCLLTLINGCLLTLINGA
jgi:hypothetical protein